MVEAKVEEAEAMKFCAFEVVALVVVANKVVIFPVVAKRFVNIPLTIESAFAKSVPLTLRLVIPEVAATSWLAARLVAVKLLAVVEANVDEAETSRLPDVVNPEVLVVVAFVVEE